MITFVYCCICYFLLIVSCQTTRFIENEDNAITNDSPDILPKVISSRYKAGADIPLKCNLNHHKHKINITWEFKHCLSNYKGSLCDPNTIYNLDMTGKEWKKINVTKKKKLEIRNATEQDVGFYRCIYNNSIIKVYMIDVIVPAKYTGPAPEVISVIPSSNSTMLPNTPLVIQCNVTSLMPPEICWFKECSGHRCEIKEKGHCYCSIPSLNSAYSKSNNIYLSKLNIESLRSVDSGTYACVAISVYGKDYKNITIIVQDNDGEETSKFSLLFLIPLSLMLVPVSIWLCFYRRRKKNHRVFNDHQKQLIQPVVKVDIVLEVDENV